jgi:hypothetical protein
MIDGASFGLLGRTTLHPRVEVLPHRAVPAIADGKDMPAFDDHSQSREGPSLTRPRDDDGRT